MPVRLTVTVDDSMDPVGNRDEQAAFLVAALLSIDWSAWPGVTVDGQLVYDSGEQQIHP